MVDTNMITFIDRVGVAVAAFVFMYLLYVQNQKWQHVLNNNCISPITVLKAACAKVAYSAIRAPVVPRRMPITALMPPRVPE